MSEPIDTKAVLDDMRATKRDLGGERPVIMTVPFNRLNRWIAALAQEIADREALERIKEAATRFRRAFLMGNNAPPSELMAAGIALEAALAAREKRA